MTRPTTIRGDSRAGFTVVELMIASSIGLAVLAVAFSFMQSSGVLFAKSSSINQSHIGARGALERLTDSLQRANALPTLIDTAGNATTSPAAGLSFDNFRGTPYVITHPGGSGLASSATSVTITRSTHARAAPPLPAVGDSLLIDTTSATVLRARIASVTVGATDTVNQRQTLTLTLSAPLGTNITWSASDPKTADLVRREAFIVMPAGGRNELRYYRTFEPLPALNNAANYSVISNQLGTQGLEGTPFTITTTGSDTVVGGNLTSRSGDYSNYLAHKQTSGFNTFLKLNTVLTSRMRPKH